MMELIEVSRRKRVDRKDFKIKYWISFEGLLCSTLYPVINEKKIFYGT